MAVKDALLSELRHEAALTRKMLERVPMDKADWKPHEKSMTIGRLATHIAQIPRWVSDIHHIDEYDFASQPRKKNTTENTEELLQIFQESVDSATRDLKEMTEEDFDKKWVVLIGGKVLYEISKKKVAIRYWAFNHQVHHRGQLSVYLRLLDIPVPGMYGPSADES